MVYVYIAESCCTSTLSVCVSPAMRPGSFQHHICMVQPSAPDESTASNKHIIPTPTKRTTHTKHKPTQPTEPTKFNRATEATASTAAAATPATPPVANSTY